MAVIKQRLLRKDSAGVYSPVYLETSADVVLMTDGTTAQAKIDNILSQISGVAAVLDAINREVV